MTRVPVIYKATGLALDLLDRVFKARISVAGAEQLVDQPTLYVVNHFTRIETFLLPHVIYKHTGRQLHSLADANVCSGKLGDYLQRLGAFSTRDGFRNRRIIGELLTGRFNWVIFPEGLMVKNKKVMEGRHLHLDNPEGGGPPHTGAAVLAMLAEITKRRYLDALRRGDKAAQRAVEERYGFAGPNELCFKDIVILPVNITYYPIRHGDNPLLGLARALVKEIPERFEEELQVEGSLLFSKSDIAVSFGQPIAVGEHVEPLMPFTRLLQPFIGQERETRLVVGLQRSRLTRRFMREIYGQVTVNFDHLFCAGLKALRGASIAREDFCRALALTAADMAERAGRRLHATLEEELVRLVADETYPPFEDVARLATEEGVLKIRGGVLEVDSALFAAPSAFHNIRLTGLVKVISNEVEPLKDLRQLLDYYVNLPSARMRRQLARSLEEKALQRFESDWRAYEEPGVSKPMEVGRPFLLKAADLELGVLLLHGFLAAPAELRPLAEHLQACGITVYAPPIRGHGTSPRQLAEVSMEEWLLSVCHGYALLKNLCRRVVVGGFSGGGLLALVMAARKQPAPAGLFCINAALKLKDRKASFAGTVVRWNEFLGKLHIESGRREYLENKSESPEINYARIPVKAVAELGRLISECQRCLPEITCPSLILQGHEDPVVEPKSATIIHERISSTRKELEMLYATRHIIVRGEGAPLVFERVGRFLATLKAEGAGSGVPK